MFSVSIRCRSNVKVKILFIFTTIHTEQMEIQFILFYQKLLNGKYERRKFKNISIQYFRYYEIHPITGESLMTLTNVNFS